MKLLKRLVTIAGILTFLGFILLISGKIIENNTILTIGVIITCIVGIVPYMVAFILCLHDLKTQLKK